MTTARTHSIWPFLLILGAPPVATLVLAACEGPTDIVVPGRFYGPGGGNGDAGSTANAGGPAPTANRSPTSNPSATTAATASPPVSRSPTTPTPSAGDGGSGSGSSSSVAGDPPPDASVGPLPATGGCGSLALCDDFESAQVGASPANGDWSVVTPNCSGSGSMTVDSSVAHSASHSVKVTGGGGYCDHTFLSASTATLGRAFFGRFYIQLQNPLGDSHVTLAAFHDQGENKDVRMGGQFGVLMWNRESDDATLPDLGQTGKSASASPAAGAWHCVEYALDGAAGAITTWLDGNQLTGLSVTTLNGTATQDLNDQWLRKSSWAPTFIDARVGWESYAGQTATLWLDDVALSSTRIGCN